MSLNESAEGDPRKPDWHFELEYEREPLAPEVDGHLSDIADLAALLSAQDKATRRLASYLNKKIDAAFAAGLSTETVADYGNLQIDVLRAYRNGDQPFYAGGALYDGSSPTPA